MLKNRISSILPNVYITHARFLHVNLGVWNFFLIYFYLILFVFYVWHQWNWNIDIKLLTWMTCKTKSTTLWAGFRQLSGIFALVDEDMRVGMFLRSTFDFNKFLPSFRDKVVGVELRYHVGSEILEGTQLGEGSRTRVSYRNSSKMIALSVGVIACRCEASGRDFCFLICLYKIPRYYLSVRLVTSTFPAKRTQHCSHF